MLTHQHGHIHIQAWGPYPNQSKERKRYKTTENQENKTHKRGMDHSLDVCVNPGRGEQGSGAGAENFLKAN